MAVKDYKLKLDKVQKLMGMYETYTPKSGKYGKGFVVTMFLTVKGGRLHLPDPYFYFGDQFVPVTDRVKTEEELTAYIKAKKPIFSLVGENRIYVKLSGFYSHTGDITCNVELIKLRKQILGDDALQVSGLSTKASDPLQRHCTALVKDIFKHVEPDFKGLSRLDFYRWRLGYTEELNNGSDKLVRELEDVEEAEVGDRARGTGTAKSTTETSSTVTRQGTAKDTEEG